MADSVDTLAEMMKKLRFDILKPEEINQQPEGAASSLQDSCRKAIVRAVGLDRLCKASELPVPKLSGRRTVDERLFRQSEQSEFGEYLELRLPRAMPTG